MDPEASGRHRQPERPKRFAAIRRGLVGLLDQGLYSLTNFVLTVLVAREATRSEFGVFAVLLAVYLVAAVVARGLTSETFVVRYSTHGTGAEWRAASRAAGAISLGLGVVIGAGFVLSSLALDGRGAALAIVFGLTLPGLFLQDFLRYSALAASLPSVAVVNDATVAVVQVGLSIVALTAFDLGGAAMVATWGIGALAGALVACVVLKVGPRFRGSVRWWRQHRDLAVRYAVDDFANQAAQQANTFFVASFGTLADAGALRGGLTMFGPLTIVNLGAMSAVTPELVRLAKRAPRRLGRATDLVAVALTVLNCAWAGAVLLVPDSLGRSLLGQTWALASTIIPLLALGQVANGIRVAAQAGLRALGDAKRTLRARSIALPILLVSTAIAAPLDGARGVAIALAVTTPIVAVVWQFYFRRALRHHHDDADTAAAQAVAAEIPELS